MSFSDLSFSSPRKEVHSEKSNDEDFERFMNEVFNFYFKILK